MDLPWDIIVSHAALRNHEFKPKYRKKSHYHVVQMLFFHWTI